MIKLAFVAFVLAACGGSKPTSEPTTAPVAAPASGGLLTITALKFYDGEENGMKLGADGLLTMKFKHSENGKPAEESWKDVATFAADGTITASGKPVGKLEADGSFKSIDGKTAPFKINGDTLDVEGKQITIDDKGVVHGGNEGFNLHVSGLTDAGSRRTALLVLAIAFAGQPAPAPVPTSGP